MKRLEYKDNVIRIYHDFESLSVFLISNDGKSRHICYDDNFFWVGEIYYAYRFLLDEYFNNFADDDDYKKLVKRFETYLLKNDTTQEELQECRDYYKRFR